MRIFFPVSLNLVGRRCLVIGAADDREASEKAAALEEAGAEVRRIFKGEDVREEDVAHAFFVISTPQDEALSQHLREWADRHRTLLCCIDQPKYGFVAMAAIAKAGPVRIAISTAGLAPRVGKILKNALQRVMDARFERFIAILAERRAKMRETRPLAEESELRRKAAIDNTAGFTADVTFYYPEWFEEGQKARVRDRGRE
ncbi:MAG TPA: NAD(P)-dependent oxidoreductase [Candidatus Tyrphobacter sp.]